jgi:hypothetical protein
MHAGITRRLEVLDGFQHLLEEKRGWSARFRQRASIRVTAR